MLLRPAPYWPDLKFTRIWKRKPLAQSAPPTTNVNKARHPLARQLQADLLAYDRHAALIGHHFDQRQIERCRRQADSVQTEWSAKNFLPLGIVMGSLVASGHAAAGFGFVMLTVVFVVLAAVFQVLRRLIGALIGRLR